MSENPEDQTEQTFIVQTPDGQLHEVAENDLARFGLSKSESNGLASIRRTGSGISSQKAIGYILTSSVLTVSVTTTALARAAASLPGIADWAPLGIPAVIIAVGFISRRRRKPPSE
jgi:hypothetical protein